jgi:hypothetical protein
VNKEFLLALIKHTEGCNKHRRVKIPSKKDDFGSKASKACEDHMTTYMLAMHLPTFYLIPSTKLHKA